MFNTALVVILIVILSNVLMCITKILKLSPILSLLLLGLISSFNQFKKIIQPNKLLIEYLGDLGIISLMFIIGYETSLKKLKKNKKDTIKIAILCFIIPFILGFGLMYYLGFNILTCFVVGEGLDNISHLEIDNCKFNTNVFDRLKPKILKSITKYIIRRF